MKIIIVGAGISGYATYLFLKKHLPESETHHEYTIYESHNTSTPSKHEVGDTHLTALALGGWLGIGPNGLKVLKRLDEQIWLDVVQRGYQYSSFQIYNPNGQRLQQSAATGDQRRSSIVINRDSFWRCLMERIPPHVVVNKRVVRVLPNPTGRHIVEFDDSSEPVTADLVIGADGLHSTVKQCIFADHGANPYPPHYEGFVGTGGLISVSEDVKKTLNPGSLTMVFGQKMSFGYVYPEQVEEFAPHRSTPVQHNADSMISWWSVYATPECPSPWTVDREDATRNLRERHAGWQDPIVQQVIQRARVETMYPVRTTPKLPTWERDGVILVGDAAHTLPPALGQGASQALEDAMTLSLFLAYYLRKFYQDKSVTTERDAIQDAANQYMGLRYPRVGAILGNARTMQQSNQTSGQASEGDHLQSVEKYDIAEEIEKCFLRMQ